ncbi:MAG: POTRA domain-containing protein, partial [Polyangiaceae bacterium]
MRILPPVSSWSSLRSCAPAASLVALCAVVASAMSLGCTSVPPGRSAVDSVELRGNRAIQASEITDVLATTATTKFLGLFRGVVYDYSVYDDSVLQRDLARVERFYRAQGFLEAHARVARVQRVGDQHVRLQIVVDEGAPTLNRTIRMDGLSGLPASISAAVRQAAESALTKGRRFDEDAYKRAQALVTAALTDRGYAYATVRTQAEADLVAHAIDYTFTVSAGIPAVFGLVTFVGLDPDGSGPRPALVDDKPLRRAVHIRDGSPYSTEKIQSATQALLDLEIFGAVHIEPNLPDPPASVVPLVVEVQPTSLRTLKVGGGIELDVIKADVHALIG